MRRLLLQACLISLIISPAFAGRLSVEELKTLLVSTLASGEPDEYTATRISRVEMRERLTDSTLAEFVKAGAGPRTAMVLRALAAESEFEPAPDTAGAPPPSAAEASAILGRARSFAASYISSLPDFLCTRVTHRLASRPAWYGSSAYMLRSLSQQDTLNSEVSFRGGHEAYSKRLVNGQPEEDAAAGLTTWGEFGGDLVALLGAGANPQVEFSRWESLSGRRVAVFRYSVDKRDSHYTVTWCCDGDHRHQAVPGYHGELFVDPRSGEVARLTRRAALLTFPTPRIDTLVEFRPVNLDATPYLLPVRSLTVTVSRIGSPFHTSRSLFQWSLNETEFRSYHKFTASSTFVATGAPPQ